MLDYLPELLVIFCGMPIGAFIAGYMSYLAWFRTDKFRNLVKKRIDGMGWFLGTGLMEAWMSTNGYIWFIRGITLLVFAFCTFVFVVAVVAALLS